MSESVILIRTGERVLVDAEDLPGLSDHRWYVRYQDGRARVYRRDRGEQILMSHEILRATNAQVRYRNGDGLDNRRQNLILKERELAPRIRVTPYGALILPKSTNHRGAAAEAAVIAELYAHGYTALRPFDGHAPYDLIIADPDHQLRRIQVKYRAKGPGERLTIPLYTMQQRNGKARMIPVNFNFIDGYAIFNPTIRRVLFIPKCDIDQSRSDFIVRPSEASSDPGDLYRMLRRIRAEVDKPLISNG